MSHRQKARLEALNALVQYDQSTTSMKTLLREMQTTSADSFDSLILAKSLSLSVIRFRNTIDFILAKSLGKKKFQALSAREQNILRIAIFETRWLQTDVKESLSSYPEIEADHFKELKRAMTFDLENAIERMPVVNCLSLKHSHPSFLVKTLLDNISVEESIELMQRNNQNRTYYARVNKLYDDHEFVLDKLENVKLRSDPDVTEIFEILDGIDSIVKSQSFKDGRILIQDKASVLTVNSLNPQPGEKIWDACAAPGMKTQLIVEKMHGRGKVVASDVYADRVKTARKLSTHLNATNIEWIHADASNPQVHDADKILIDAPCTSTGILQAYPSFKWRLNKETLFALMTVQNKILDAILAAYTDRPGTEIVFSTCSILPHEGESQIDSALQMHNVELLTPIDYGSLGYPRFKCSKRVRRLFPHKHETSGFFIARLRIKQ